MKHLFYAQCICVEIIMTRGFHFFLSVSAGAGPWASTAVSGGYRDIPLYQKNPCTALFAST